MNLGQSIKELREQHDFRVQDFAVALLVSPNAVKRLENNEFREIRQRWIQTIASLTGRQSSEITEGRVHYFDPARQVYVLREEDVTPAAE